MIADHQTLIRGRDLAQEIGISTATLWRWTVNDVRVRACVFRRGWYSIARLRDAGIVAAPAPHSDVPPLTIGGAS